MASHITAIPSYSHQRAELPATVMLPFPVTTAVTRKVLGPMTIVWHTPPPAPAMNPAEVDPVHGRSHTCTAYIWDGACYQAVVEAARSPMPTAAHPSAIASFE